MLAAVSAILNPNNTDPTMPFTDNVTVRRFGNVYQLLFRGEDTATTIAWVDTSALTGTLALATRVNGINYYGVETLNIDLGLGQRRLQRPGHDGDDEPLARRRRRARLRVLGRGLRPGRPSGLPLRRPRPGARRAEHRRRHRPPQLMISDEAALVGDSDVRITDAPGSEILVSGLAPAPITYKAAASGNFADGITIWSGSGDDRILVDATHGAPACAPSPRSTPASATTRSGSTCTPGSDDSFVLDTQGGYDSVLRRRRRPARGRHQHAGRQRPRLDRRRRGAGRRTGPTGSCACCAAAARTRRSRSRSRAPTSRPSSLGAGGTVTFTSARRSPPATR